MLKLNGKPFKAAPPAKDALQRFLDSSASDEIFTQAHITAKLGISISCLKDAAVKLPSYTAVVGRIRYWGCPAAIKELRKQVAA